MSPLRFTIIRPYPAGRGTAPPPPPKVITLTLDTTVGVVAGPVLTKGTVYTITATGTSIDWNRGPLTVGNPEPDAMFPTTGGNKRRSTQVGMDAETVFASDRSGYRIGARQNLEISTGGNFVRVPPAGGPYTTPRPGHSYTYRVTGAGAPLELRWADSVLNDNYGAYRIEVSA